MSCEEGVVIFSIDNKDMQCIAVYDHKFDTLYSRYSKLDYQEFFLIQGHQVVSLANSYVAMVNVSIEVQFATVSMIALMRQTKEIVVSLRKKCFYIFAHYSLRHLAQVDFHEIRLTFVALLCKNCYQSSRILKIISEY